MSGTDGAARGLIGRELELAGICESLSEAASGKGSCILISGEPGIGKTRLVDEVKARARGMGFALLNGSCSADGAEPFLPFSAALGATLFQADEYVSLAKALVIDDAGTIVAKASSMGAGDMSSEVFAGILATVQSFVKDSFDGQEGSLGRLEYGEMRVRIERFRGGFLAAISHGPEHEGMHRLVRDAAQRIGGMLGSGSHSLGCDPVVVGSIGKVVGALVSERFLVRRSLESVKLDVERNKISDIIFGELAARSASRPVLLVIEDMHWADESSFFVLEYLARSVKAERISMIATMRREEGPKAAALADKLAAEGSAIEMCLRPIDEDAARALIDSIFSPNDFPQGFSSRMAADCKGNPFFLMEMLKQMASDGSVAMRDGRHCLTSLEITVPSTIEELVQRRLDALDPDAMTMAEYASCIGREFDVGAALSLRTINDAKAALGKLCASGVMSLKGERSEFAHAYFQSVVYSNITPRWRSAHHKSLGEYYEASFEGRLEEAYYELARHFSLTAEHAKAYAYSVKAGEKAESVFAAEQAAIYYGHAISVLEKMDGPRAAEMASLLERLGEVQLAAGQYDKALESYARALQASADPLVKARLHRKRSAAHERLSDFPAAVEEAAKGMELVGPNELEYLRLVVQKGGVGLRKGDFDGVIKVFEEVLPRLREFAEAKKDVARAHSVLGFAYIRKGRHEKALKNLQRSMAIMGEVGDVLGMANTYNNIGILHYNRGELDEAWAAYSSSLKIYEERKDSGGVSLLYNNMSLVRSAKGDMDSGLDMLRKSLAIRRRLGDQTGVAMCLVNIGEMLGETGQWDAAMDNYRENYEIVQRLNDRRGAALACSNIATQLARKGEWGPAEDWYLRGIATSREHDVKDYLVEGLLGLAQVCVSTGRLDEAGRLCAEAETGARASGYKVYEGYCLRVLGTLRAASGDIAGAERCFSDAKLSYDALKMDGDAAKVLYDWGRTLVSSGEAARGLTMLKEAKGTFERMGLRYWAALCGELLGDSPGS